MTGGAGSTGAGAGVRAGVVRSPVLQPAAAAVLAAAVLFGTTGTAKALGPDDASPSAVGVLRIGVGAAALWLLAGRPDRRAWRREHVRWLVAGGAGVAAYQPTFFTGTERGGVALGTIVALGSAPLFAGALDAVLFRRRPGPAWVRAMAVALAGLVVLVAAQGGAATLDALGVVCSLGAGLSYAVYAVAGKVLIVRGVASTAAMAALFSVGALLLAPVLATEPLGWVATGAGVAMVAYLGVVTVGVAYALYGAGLRTLATATVVLLTLAEPVTAAVAGVVVLDERLPALGWVGAATVLAGLALAARITTAGARPASRSPRPVPPPPR